MAGKADIVDAIADGVEGITKKQAAEAFDATVETIAKMLKKGERVQIPGLGSLSVSKRAARMGRNPKTGESIKIKASKVAKFKMGKELKERLN
ncbi:MAG: HU family DNA-binding protein [Acidobacteria bacterium]|mgnify:CR=1 FL=1|nr:MAG: HU family DNA-binding protein [Acidobacteriota bacterium]REK00562.1 MAG: HU family DNA-binding protein [Acidobacteriota bacterium]